MHDPNLKVAIKVLDKAKMKYELDIVMDEVAVLNKLDHPCIVKYFETYNDAKYIYLVMEFIDGCHLFKHITSQPLEHFGEQMACKYFKDIVSAISHCHAQNVIHRDIKPENIMVTTNDEIKVIDFGLSKNARSVTNHQIVGTPFYIAPEIIQDRPYDTQVDIWSLGVLLYIMLSGHYPFSANEQTVLFEKIARGHYSFNHEEFDSVSSEGKDLISKMLVLEPKLRLTACQILKHPWFNKFSPAQTVTKSVDQLDVKTFTKLRSYKGVSHFKRAAMNILIKMSSEEQLH